VQLVPLTVAESEEFVTSDNPCFWTNPKAQEFWERGLGSRDAELNYSLTRQVMMLGNWQGVSGSDAPRRHTFFESIESSPPLRTVRFTVVLMAAAMSSAAVVCSPLWSK
jgi:hypothetical protein